MDRPLSFKGYRFPPGAISQAVFLYFRFTLSLRDVEELLAQRASRSATRRYGNGRSGSGR